MKNSNAMELESLKRQLCYLDQANVVVKKLVTDRHGQVAAYRAEERPDTEHNYDVWHLAKGLFFIISFSYNLLNITMHSELGNAKIWIPNSIY